MCKPYPKEPPEQHAADLRARIMNPAYEIPEMLSMKTCAEKLNVSYFFIRNLCLTGKIVFVKSGNRYLVNFGKLCEYLNTEGQVNR